MTKLVYAVCIASLLALGACKGGGSKCEKAIDKSMNIGMKMAEEMGAMAGDGAEEAQAKMKAEMASKLPEAIKKCEAAVKENPEFEKALDCILAADGLEGLSKCDSSALNGLVK